MSKKFTWFFAESIINFAYKINLFFRTDKVFLYFVILCCVTNCYFYYTQNQAKSVSSSAPMEAIISGFSQFGFVKQPVLVIHNQLYFAQSKAKLNLNVGQNLMVQGDIKPFIFDGSFNEYLLTTGVVGTIDIQNIYISPSCNWQCHFFKNLDNIKYNYTKNYNNWFCSQQVKKWLSNLANCLDLAGLAIGFSIGGSQSLTDATKQNFKDLGLTHLIAVSGFQVVLMVDIAFKLAEKLKLVSKIRSLLQIILILALVFIVGLQAPVLRAGISGIISLFASNLGRHISAFRSLIWSAIILCFWNPAIIFSLSFQLSFAATLGLILLPSFNFLTRSNLPGFVQELISAFLTSLAATLWTLPLIVQINGKISVLSVLVNVLVSPFISFSTILSFLGQIPILGELFSFINSAILILILNIVDLFSKINIFLNFEKFGVGEMLGYYGFLLLILFIMKKASVKPAVFL